MPLSKFKGQLQSKKRFFIYWIWLVGSWEFVNVSKCLVWCLNNLYKKSSTTSPLLKRAAALQPLKLAKFQIFSSTSSPKCHASISAPHHALSRFQEESFNSCQKKRQSPTSQKTFQTWKLSKEYIQLTHVKTDPFLLPVANPNHNHHQHYGSQPLSPRNPSPVHTATGGVWASKSGVSTSITKERPIAC